MNEKLFEKNKSYRLTNIYGSVTLIETRGNKVYIIGGFSTGYAGTIREFTKFIEGKAEDKEPIKIEQI